MDQFLKEVEELVGVAEKSKDDDEEVHPYGELDKNIPFIKERYCDVMLTHIFIFNFCVVVEAHLEKSKVLQSAR